MKKRNYIYSTIAAILLLISCGKENSDVFTPTGVTSGSDTNWVATVTSSSAIRDLQAELLLPTMLDSFDASRVATINFPSGLQVSIPANSVSGGSLSGKVYIEALLIKKKGDMIRVDKPTISFGRQLISGGEIFVKLRNNGNELNLLPGKKISIRYGDLNVSPFMKVFYGDETNPERFNWVQGQDSVFVNTQPLPGYELLSSKLRWINCDYFADTTGQRTSIHASLPVNFTNANTSVYLVYKEQRSVLPLYGNALSKRFISGNLPVGKQVTAVAVSKQGQNSYYLGHQSFIIGANATPAQMQVILMNPVPMSLSDIKAYLDTL